MSDLQPTVIRAELSGSDRCSALGVEFVAASPVLGLCRILVDSGYNPSIPMEAYRGDTLCLKVRSIGDGANLEINSTGTGFRPRKSQIDAGREAGRAPPICSADAPVSEAVPV
jgi:hypothetical protein